MKVHHQFAVRLKSKSMVFRTNLGNQAITEYENGMASFTLENAVSYY